MALSEEQVGRLKFRRVVSAERLLNPSKTPWEIHKQYNICFNTVKQLLSSAGPEAAAPHLQTERCPVT